MKRAVGYPPNATPISYIEIPTKSAGTGFLKPHPILCPIDSFERAIRDEERRFKYLTADVDEIPQFWNGIRNSTLFREISAHINPLKSYPCWVHGDGAPTNKVDGLFSISWGSVLARGPTATSRFLYTVIRESDLNDETLDALFADFAFRCNILVTGVHPALLKNGRINPKAGQPINTDGFTAPMIFLKGDWEFHANVVHVPRWDNAINMCPCCSASNTILALLWTQNGWRDTKRSHREFLEAMRDQGRTISGIWLIKTLTVRGFIWDVLHALDLGLSSHVNANVYVELMDDGVFGNGTMASKVSNLEADLKTFYKNNVELHRIAGELSINRIKTGGDWPKLKAKGAQTRHICKYTLELARTHNKHTTHDEDRLVVIELLCKYYDTIELDGMFHPESSQRDLKLLGVACLGAYKRLSKSAVTAQKRAWEMVAKIHGFMHLCDDLPSIINARFVWSYSDKDLQKLVKEIAVTLHPANVANHLLLKIVVYSECDFNSDSDG